MIEKVSTPNPNWKAGESIPAPNLEMIALDPATMETQHVYKLLIGSIVPRPIAFVSTLSPEGIVNLAPFSFFNGVSSNPPTLCFSVAVQADGKPKDTARNIGANAQFVVNIVSEWFVESMVQCAALYPSAVSELSAAGFTPLPSKIVKPPRIKESAIQMECLLYKSVTIGDGSPGSATLFVGEVKMFHLATIVYDPQTGRINFEALKPVARLGGINYGRLTEQYSIPVPEVE